jgi:hypothetical protein
MLEQRKVMMQREEVLQSIVIIASVLSPIALVTSLTDSHKGPLLLQNASASPSPSFQRQELTLGSGSWFDMIWQNSTTTGPHYADLQSVSYLSNGTHLDATLWLANFETTPNDYENVNYGIYFDADSNNRTGLNGIDYNLEISWNNESRTWTRAFEEWSSNGQNKTLDKKENMSDFFEVGGKFVTMSADLSPMLSPDHYRVLFYAEVINQEKVPFYWIIDSTNWISIPSPKLVFTVLPNPIVLIQGGESIAEVRINSSTADEVELHISPNVPENSSNSKLITGKLDSEKLIIPPFGTASTHLRVSITSDIAPTDYLIIMRANVTPVNTPSFAAAGITQSGTQSTFSAKDGKNALSEYISKKITDQTVSKSSVFSLQVKKWSFEEQLNSFVNLWITPLTAVYTSISSIVAGTLGWIYGRRGRGEKRKTKTDNQNNDNIRTKANPGDK